MDPFDLDYDEFGLKQVKAMLVEVGRERRQYCCYLEEVWKQHKNAVRAWSAFHSEKNLNSTMKSMGSEASIQKAK